MASVTYGKCIMANVIMAKIFMAKILWQMKLSLLKLFNIANFRGIEKTCMEEMLYKSNQNLIR